MPTYPDQINLEKRLAELEQEVQLYKRESIKYKTLFNSFPHGITVSDKNGNIIETNAAAEQLLGVNKTEHEKRAIDGQEWRIIRPDGSDMPPEEWASVIALKENRVASGCEMGIHKSPNDIVWINVTAAPLPIRDHGVVVTYSDISELKQTRDSLIQNNARYMDAQRIGKVGNWEYDITKETFWGSDEAKRIYGFDPDSMEFSTDDVENCIPERERVHQALVDLIEQNKPYNLEFEIHPISGPGRKIIQSIAELSSDNTGIKVKGVIQDITDRKDMEAALLKSQAQLKERNQLLSAILEHTHMMAVFLDEQFNFIWVNQAYADTCRKPVSFFPGKNHFDLYPHEENQSIFERVVKTGKEYFVAAKPFEFPDQPERGITYWDWSLRPVLDEAGKVSGLVFTLADVTERIRAELALQESEVKFRTLVDQAPAALFLHDMEGRIIDVNQGAVDGYGYTREELLRMTAQDIDLNYISREDGGKFWEELDRSKRVDFEADHRRKDGSRFPVKLSLTPILLGNEKHIFALAVDMTEQKQYLEKLQNSEERFRLAYQTSPDSISLNRLCDGTYIDINNGFTEIMGYTKDDVVGKTSLSLNIWKDPEDRIRLIQGLRQSGYVENMEARFHAKDGSMKDGLMSARILSLKGEDTIISITRDITERKKMEEHLHFLSSITAGVSDSIVVTNLDFEIIYINTAAEDLFGYTSEELIGVRPDIFNAEPSVNNRQKELYETIRKGELYFGVSLNRRKDGSTFYCEYKVMPLKNKDGEFYAYVGVHRDITDKIRLEEQIRKSQKMESIGTLAGGIAHDFNNILYPIIGMAEILIEDLPSGSLERENADEILKAGLRGRELVKQILAFSRQSEYQQIPTRVQHILKEVVKLTKSTIPANIEIAQIIQSDCGLIMADATQMHQVAMNLITNAYHAIENNRNGKITIQLQEREAAGADSSSIGNQAGRYAVISITDNGCGIPPDTIEKIFDPYYTTKEQGKGTGLGLAVVYGIVQAHNGTIKVYSDVGKGTTFEVYLPLMEKPVSAASLDESEQIFTGTERILLVDDEEAIAKLEKRMLERLGYTVTSRLNSMEALEAFKAQKNNFDLVITDMSMPAMTGDQLAIELLAINPEIPIIVCTGFSERIDDQKARDIGVKGLLMKPIVKKELAEMVRKVLDEAKK